MCPIELDEKHKNTLASCSLVQKSLSWKWSNFAMVRIGLKSKSAPVPLAQKSNRIIGRSVQAMTARHRFHGTRPEIASGND
jgi:hypothetical protein